jgi:hypothetical protein
MEKTPDEETLDALTDVFSELGVRRARSDALSTASAVMAKLPGLTVRNPTPLDTSGLYAALQALHDAATGDSNDAEIDAAHELAGEVEALLSQPLTIGQFAEGQPFCGCGQPLVMSGGVWLHRYNDEWTGNHDHVPHLDHEWSSK